MSGWVGGRRRLGCNTKRFFSCGAVFQRLDTLDILGWLSRMESFKVICAKSLSACLGI
jgi:hypothetical protein